MFDLVLTSCNGVHMRAVFKRPCHPVHVIQSPLLCSIDVYVR